MARTTNGGGSKANDPLDLSRHIAHWNTLSLGRRVVLILVVSLGAFVVVGMLGTTFASFSKSLSYGKSAAMYDMAEYGGTSGVAESGRPASARAPAISAEDIASSYIPMAMSSPEPPHDPSYVPGEDAEEFEIQSFTVAYETNQLSATCDAISALKPNQDVVFTYAQSGEKYCAYRFKVATLALPEVLGYLESLDPKELTQTTESVKRRIDDFMDRRAILTQNADAVEAVLTEAIDSFDALSMLAEREGNADALARSITKKIELIDQLRQRREHIRNQLDSLNRAEAELRDRLAFVTFAVSVREVVYIDRERMSDSWRAALQRFVTTTNDLMQKVTVGLVSFILYLAVFAVYGFILLLVLKFGWRFVRDMWHS